VIAMEKRLKTSTKVYLTLGLIALSILLLYVASKTLDTYAIRILRLIAVFGVMAVSYTFINGITGLFSLGHAGFVAIGAYTSALLTMSPMQKEMSYILEPLIWPLNAIQTDFFTATLAAGVMAALFAFLIGYPSLRLTGDYLAIATLGFSEIIRIMALNMQSVTNGALGLKGLPEYSNIWWTWGWLLITVVVITSLTYSSFGRALKAIRDDAIAAEAMGINVFKHQLMAFVISGFFAGVGGSLYAHLLTTIDPRPTTIGVMLTFYLLIMIVLGGLGSITGAIIGAALFAILSEWLRFVEGTMHIGKWTIHGIPGMRMVIFSLLFIITMLVWRRGIMGMEELTWDKLYNWILRLRSRKKEG